MINAWPAWHPDQELKAEDLCSLEDYVMTRIQLADESAWGVESLDSWEESIKVEKSSHGLLIRVRQVRGITPGGDHVWLFAEDESIETTVETQSTEASEFDLWVVVNDRGKTSPKFSLRAIALMTTEDADPVSNFRTPHNLYLGRYRQDGTVLHLVNRPMPRKLSGFGSVDEMAWRAWVKPLFARLSEVGKELASPSLSHFSDVAAALEITRLGFEWPDLPIPVLARRLRLVAWLRERRERDGFSPCNQPNFYSLPREVTGDLLPEALASLLPIKTYAPEDFASTFGSLLRAVVAQQGINYFAPLAHIQAWSNRVTGSLAQRSESASAITSDVQKTIEECQILASNEWCKAFALLTVLALKRDLGWDAPASSLDPYLRSGGKDLAESLAKVLDDLFIKKAQTARAGPLAFYWIAKTSLRFPEIPAMCSRPLASYLKQLSAAAGTPSALDGPRRGSDPGDDRLSKFLSRTNVVNEPRDVLPDTWLVRRSASREGKALAGELRIVILGPRYSGKTSLAQEVVKASSAQNSLRMPFQLSRGKVVREGVEGVEVEATVIAGGNEISIRILESPLSVAPKGGVDLVIVTIAPSSIFEPNAESEISRLEGVLEATLMQNPSTMVAIAYTKSDEYGVIDDDAIRIITQAHTRSLDGIRSKCRATKESDFGQEWAAFTKSEIKADMQQKRGEALIGAARRTVGEREWLPTQQVVIQHTRRLWEVALRPDSPALLGAYFVAAKPVDLFYEPWSKRGLAQILADFISNQSQDRRTYKDAGASAAPGGSRAHGRRPTGSH